MTETKLGAPIRWPLPRDTFLATYTHPFLLVEHGDSTSSAYMTIMSEAALPTSTELYPLCKRRPSAFSFITLGRATNNDIVIKDPSVSKAHLAFHEFGGTYQVTDMGSRNGTRLNDERLEAKVPVDLENEDMLTLSDVVRVVFLAPSRAYLWLSANQPGPV